MNTRTQYGFHAMLAVMALLMAAAATAQAQDKPMPFPFKTVPGYPLAEAFTPAMTTSGHEVQGPPETHTDPPHLRCWASALVLALLIAAGPFPIAAEPLDSLAAVRSRIRMGAEILLDPSDTREEIQMHFRRMKETGVTVARMFAMQFTNLHVLELRERVLHPDDGGRRLSRFVWWPQGVTRTR